jgi:hypothetical protein
VIWFIAFLLGVLGWIVVRNVRPARSKPAAEAAPHKMFGRGFRIAAGVPALLSAVILLPWSLDQEPWKIAIPVYLFVLAGACLLPRALASLLRPTLLLATAALLVWAAATLCNLDDYAGMAIGAVLGTLGGWFGGFAGGYISRLLGPEARLVGPDDRARFAVQGGLNGRGLGAVSGLVMGAIVGLLSEHAPVTLVWWLGATCIYGYAISEWMETAAGESVDSLPGAVIGGGCAGVLAGHVAKLAVLSLM